MCIWPCAIDQSCIYRKDGAISKFYYIQEETISLRLQHGLKVLLEGRNYNVGRLGILRQQDFLWVHKGKNNTCGRCSHLCIRGIEMRCRNDFGRCGCVSEDQVIIHFLYDGTCSHRSLTKGLRRLYWAPTTAISYWPYACDSKSHP